MSRLVVLMRILEGQAGSVSAYVVPRAAPQTSAAVTYPVHTLCMHHRVHTPDDGRTYGHVDVSGDFTAQQMHAWVSKVLPDVPRQSAEEETRLAYRSAALDTHVIVSFRNGTARFASDSAAALAMLRTALTRCAAVRRWPAWGHARLADCVQRGSAGVDSDLVRAYLPHTQFSLAPVAIVDRVVNRACHHGQVGGQATQGGGCWTAIAASAWCRQQAGFAPITDGAWRLRRSFQPLL